MKDLDLKSDIDYILLDSYRNNHNPPIGLIGGDNLTQRLITAIEEEYVDEVVDITVEDSAYTLYVTFSNDTTPVILTLTRMYNY